MSKRMGRVFREYTEVKNAFFCRKCRTPVASFSNVHSKAFKCESGKAYLFKSVMNVEFAVTHEQAMATGKHCIQFAYCKDELCGR
jgi:hypothetical protein